MADGEKDIDTLDRADVVEVARESKDRPVVVDRAEVSVRGVRQCTVGDEVAADNAVLASLPREVRGLERRVVRGTVYTQEIQSLGEPTRTRMEALTLGVIVRLAVYRLARELNLVRVDGALRRRPVRCQSVVTRDPFS